MHHRCPIKTSSPLPGHCQRHCSSFLCAGAVDSLVQKRKRSMQDSVQHLRRLASEKSASLSNLKLSPREQAEGPQIPASRLR